MLKEISPEYALEGLILKLKFHKLPGATKTQTKPHQRTYADDKHVKRCSTAYVIRELR